MDINYKIIPSPDFMHRKEIEQAVKDNDGYCPCKIGKLEENLCICKEFQEQQQSGFCHCGRYYKVLNTPKVCLCGSTKFKNTFFEVARKFTLKGYIVMMPVVFMHSGDVVTEDEEKYFSEIQKTKIAEADLIYIINVNGYIGHSTYNEIKWAKELNKTIQYLEK